MDWKRFIGIFGLGLALAYGIVFMFLLEIGIPNDGHIFGESDIVFLIFLLGLSLYEGTK